MAEYSLWPVHFITMAGAMPRERALTMKVRRAQWEDSTSCLGNVLSMRCEPKYWAKVTGVSMPAVLPISFRQRLMVLSDSFPIF